MTDIKNYLNRYGEICGEIKALEEDLIFLESITEYRSVDFGRTGSGSKGVFDRIGINASKIMDIEMELKAKVESLSRLKADIQRRVDSLPNAKQRRILTERYIDGKSWCQIAEDNGIGERWMFRLHKSGLEKLEESIMKM